jgi:hypothetical protein
VDLQHVEDDVATFAWVNVFDDGEVVQGTGRLRFRSRDELEDSLRVAGFDVTSWFDDVEIVVATRRR